MSQLSSTTLESATKNVEVAFIREKQIKLLLLGDSSTGKTCILQKFTDDTFNLSFITTIGIDFRTKEMTYKGNKKKVVIWDTAGQERFRNITKAYYRGSLGMLLVYDITNKTTFENISRWMKEIKSSTSEDLEIILIGNKIDLPDRQVTTEQGQMLADSYNIPFLETSAKTGENIKIAFEQIFTKICDSIEKKTLEFEKYRQDTLCLNPTPRSTSNNSRCACSK